MHEKAKNLGYKKNGRTSEYNILKRAKAVGSVPEDAKPPPKHLYSVTKDSHSGCLVEAPTRELAKKKAEEKTGWQKFSLKDMGEISGG